MELKWTQTYDSDEHSFPPWLEGVFVPGAQTTGFYYKAHQMVKYLEADDTGIRAQGSICDGRDLKLPGRWVLMPDGLLVCSETVSIDTRTRQVTPTTEEGQQALQAREQRAWDTSVGRDYLFGPYTLRHNGGFSYTCLRDGAPIWKLRVQGYLYTHIYTFGENIYFGTDGMGGRFYIVELATGRLVAEIRTGGTNHFAGSGDSRYVLRLGKKPAVLKVSLADGSILDEAILPGIANSDCRVFADGSGIYATTFRALGRLNTAWLLHRLEDESAPAAEKMLKSHISILDR